MPPAPAHCPALPQPARRPWGLTAVVAAAVALPFLFGVTQAPHSNFWPLMASAACAWGLAALAWARACSGHWARRPASCCAARAAHGGADVLAHGLALGLLAAALLGGAIGLVQFFVGDAGLSPWLRASTPGQAIGNLRQRNQQATLIALGLWGLLWTLARLQEHLQEHLPGRPQATTAAGAGVGAARASLPGHFAHPPAGAPRALPAALVSALGGAALVLLAAAGAATASRTGALQWLLVPGLLLCWRRSSGALVLGAGVLGLAWYLLAAWWLPGLLTQSSGVEMADLFARLGQESARPCTSRRALWGNVLELIAARPWTGWGWGELDYAHYITPMRGLRFCALLDNAHNLPLHLAVELGLPLALALTGAALLATLRARPWRERQPARQLAWGVLALIGLHSLVEFPLWYGPFQLAAALALVLLIAPACGRAVQALAPPTGRAVHAAAGAGLLAAAALALALARDYATVAALYRPVAERPPALRSLTAAEAVRQLRFFRAPAEFAWLTTTPVSARQAPALHAAALRLLHYSPEPRVFDKLIASAQLLGRGDEARLHTERYRDTWPQEFARWQGGRAVAASSTAGTGTDASAKTGTAPGAAPAPDASAAP